jgi:SAM-dependent methyltransferase
VGLGEIRRAWTELGAQDPLWAVLVAPDKRHGRWDEAQFLATGVTEIDRALGWLDRLELARPTAGRPRFGRVLDFGCGAGRLSQALSRHAGEVVGVDVSQPMLATAKRLNAQPNCRFVLNDATDLGQFAAGSFDLVYTTLVLQHLPRPLIEGYLAEFHRVLAPGGLALLQFATRPRGTARGLIWRSAPWPLIRVAQRRVLHYPAPMRMTRMPESRVRALVGAAGGTVVDSEPDLASSPDWVCTRYVIERR